MSILSFYNSCYECCILLKSLYQSLFKQYKMFILHTKILKVKTFIKRVKIQFCVILRKTNDSRRCFPFTALIKSKRFVLIFLILKALLYNSVCIKHFERHGLRTPAHFLVLNIFIWAKPCSYLTFKIVKAQRLTQTAACGA